MNSEKKKFIILITILICFAATSLFFGNQNTDEQTTKETEKEQEDIEETVGTYSSVKDDSDFFTDYRISREKERDASEESLRIVAEDATRNEKARAEADSALQILLKKNASEDSIEKILLGRNYRDALFIYNESMPLLIINQENLTEAEKTELKSFVGAYLGISPDIISVFTVWEEAKRE